MITVAQVIGLARAMGIDRLDAQLLVARRLGVDRPWLLAHPDAGLDDAHEAGCRADFARRADGVPLAYITGEREFHGLRLEVTADVLDPRPDTETLVDWALECLGDATCDVADLGTGSGAIALAIKNARPHATVRATDRSAPALALARENARRLGLDIEWSEGDWWQALPGACFDLVVSNPPYVAADDPHMQALRHEPSQALSPGPRGLEAIERIISGSRPHLRHGAWLLLEHGFDQAAEVRRCLSREGFVGVTTRSDLSGTPRCTGGRLESEIGAG
jgi:release factor glutamine methyltransferase